MTVRELLYNPNFDINCKCLVFDCSPINKTWREAHVIYSTDMGYNPSAAILDMEVRYITINENRLIVEAIRRN